MVNYQARIDGPFTSSTAYAWTASAGSPSTKTSTGGSSPYFDTKLAAPGSMTVTLEACNGVACTTKIQIVSVH